MTRLQSTITTTLLLLLLSLCSAAATHYVRAGATGTGSSWADASGDLAAILSDAAYGDAVWVAEGSYLPSSGTDRTVSFLLGNGVQLYGGFPSTGTPAFADRDWRTHLTYLDGNIGSDTTETDNAYIVLKAHDVDSTTVLDGFVLQHAYNENWYEYGGAVQVAAPNGTFSNPTIRNCTFQHNNTFGGCGIGVWGMWNEPGRDLSLTVSHCIFKNNTSHQQGGAMHLETESDQYCNVKLWNCLFTRNSGGSAYNARSNSTSQVYSRISNCTFAMNFPKCIVIDEPSTNNTPQTTSKLYLENSIVARSDADASLGVSGVLHVNGIQLIRNNLNHSEGHTITNCVYYEPYTVCPPGATCTNVQYTAPLYSDVVNDDYTLQTTSPAVNAGENALVPSALTADLDGNDRIFGLVDLGAYESDVEWVPPIGFQELSAERSGIAVSPNPSPGWLRVSAPVDQLQIFDVHGRPVLQRNAVDAGGAIIQHELTPGVYLVVAMRGSEQLSTRLVVR